MINPMQLEKKHIVITGASSGIGRATAILASKLGATVSLVARNKERLEKTVLEMENNPGCCFCSDLAQISEIENLVKLIVERNGPIDGFVHCAGMGINRPISISKNEFISQTMQINFYAFAELLRVFTKRKNSHDGASCIAISSVASLKGDKAQGAYAASKAALNGYIHPAAKELAPRGIRVNTVAFGMIATELYEEFKRCGGSAEEQLRGQYLGIGTTTDAANIICFLLSDGAKFITGTTVIADGGYCS